MKRIFVLVTVVASLLFCSCQKEDTTISTTDEAYVKGKNRFTIVVDGDTREYYVHVPHSYTGSTTVPVVFMLHGTSGDGEKFYNNSGWREVGEDEDIITVFPSSWRYCIIDDGVQKNTTKWNTYPDTEWYFCSGQTPRNDIKFLSAIITALNGKFKIDNKRIYLSGFSNGGQMAAKCAIELSDKLAAVVENAGTFYRDTVYTPKRKLPVMYQVGNEDYGPGNTGPSIPLSKFDSLISNPGVTFYNGKFYRTANNHVRNFGLNPVHTIAGDTSAAVVATYLPLVPGSGYEFKYVLVKGLAHQYPNGDNHWMEGARMQWTWMKQYSMP
jgi:polyhydroxybutyrate depolymerase